MASPGILSRARDLRRLGAIADLLDEARRATRERDDIWLRRLDVGDCSQSDLARASRVTRAMVQKAKRVAGEPG